jgi:transposase
VRGPSPSYPIQLSDDEAPQLLCLIRIHSTPQSLAFRARIVVTAHDHPDWSNQQIAQHCHTSDRIVRKWRRRWSETKSIADAPHPGAPRRFSP